MRNGILAALIANIHRKKNSRAYKPEDFMPREQDEKPKQTVAEQAAILKSIYAWAKRKGLAKKKDE